MKEIRCPPLTEIEKEEVAVALSLYALLLRSRDQSLYADHIQRLSDRFCLLSEINFVRE